VPKALDKDDLGQLPRDWHRYPVLALEGICVNLSHYLLENWRLYNQEDLPESRVYAEVGAKLQRARGGSTAP
jgi:hypothetical protein